VDAEEGADLWRAQVQALATSAAEQSRGRVVGLPSDRPPGVSLEAQLQLVAELTRFAGYSSVITYGSSVPGWRPQPGEGGIPEDADLTAEQVRDSLSKFVGSLVRYGWKPSEDAPLFLVRPAALINPGATLQPHERVITASSRLIAWRLPDQLVDYLFEAASERQVERQRLVESVSPSGVEPALATETPAVADDESWYAAQESRRVYRPR
jgi:hypothetical protein